MHDVDAHGAAHGTADTGPERRTVGEPNDSDANRQPNGEPVKPDGESHFQSNKGRRDEQPDGESNRRSDGEPDGQPDGEPDCRADESDCEANCGPDCQPNVQFLLRELRQQRHAAQHLSVVRAGLLLHDSETDLESDIHA